MEYLVLIITCWTIGLIAAIPIGPVNLICIRRTLQCGWKYGFTSGLGAALGDGLFATITAFGLTAIAQLINGFSMPLQIVGGVALLIFGIRTFIAAPPSRINETFSPFPEVAGAKAANGGNGCGNGKNGGPNGKNGVTNGGVKDDAKSRARGMASTFALTITNPATLLFFAAWFTSLGGLADDPSFFQAAFAVLGVLLGSATWWLVLTFSVGKAHARIDDGVVQVINRISGVLVGLFGLILLVHVGLPHLL
ncbi:MAG TPA: LysE family transporter [Rhizomicrobium sp.]|nr:LysE family transporter [Rhizomicrobium sp.]